MANTDLTLKDHHMIIHMRMYGHTMHHIGMKFGVTRERIRQILLKYDISGHRKDIDICDVDLGAFEQEDEDYMLLYEDD